jgi:heptosyltransferase-2
LTKKTLIIRFSSFGDIAQCLEAARRLKAELGYDVHFLTRDDFQDFLKDFEFIDKVLSYERNSGLKGLIKLAKDIKNTNFNIIYDAHNNLRSLLLCTLLRLQLSQHKLIRRSKDRIKRFLLFKLRINLFESPFRGQISYLKPLKVIGINQDARQKKLSGNIKSNNRQIVIAPSANWELKRWPTHYWQELVRHLPEYEFTILAGPTDNFCNDIASAAPNRVKNLAGNLSWRETSKIIKESQLVVSGDTGVLHLADFYQVPVIALIGPTAFGYPTNSTSQVYEVNLKCKPCSKDGRGKCSNSVYKKCLMDIKSDFIASEIRRLFTC